jgi:hypothetical protein
MFSEALAKGIVEEVLTKVCGTVILRGKNSELAILAISGLVVSGLTKVNNRQMNGCRTNLKKFAGRQLANKEKKQRLPNTFDKIFVQPILALSSWLCGAPACSCRGLPWLCPPGCVEHLPVAAEAHPGSVLLAVWSTCL